MHQLLLNLNNSDTHYICIGNNCMLHRFLFLQRTILHWSFINLHKCRGSHLLHYCRKLTLTETFNLQLKQNT